MRGALYDLYIMGDRYDPQIIDLPYDLRDILTIYDPWIILGEKG